MSGDHFVRVRYRHPGLDVDENRTAHEGEECVRVFIIFPYGHSTKRTLLLVTHGEEPSRKILVPHRPEELLGGGMEAGVQGRDTLASTVIERGRRTTLIELDNSSWALSLYSIRRRLSAPVNDSKATSVPEYPLFQWPYVCRAESVGPYVSLVPPALVMGENVRRIGSAKIRSSITLLSLLPPCGSGEASGTYTLILPHYSRLQPRVLPMPSRNPLNQLRGLDTSSSTFHDQVSNILYGEEYKRWMPNLQGDDLVGFVDYLDKVRHHVSLVCSPLNLQ